MNSAANAAAAAAAPPALPAPSQQSSDIDPSHLINFINFDIFNPLRQSLFDDFGAQTKCCAHDDCTIDPGIAHKPVPGLHNCSNCRLKLHSALTCGETLSDIILLEEEKYDYRYFSGFGQDKLDSNIDSDSIYFCYTCLKQIEEATAQNVLPPPFRPPRSSMPAAAGAAAGGGGGGDTSRISLLLPSEEIHTTKTMNEVMKDDTCMAELDYTHLVVTAGATNKVVNQKTSPLTKLKGVTLGEHELSTQNCTLDNLRKLGMKWKIRGARSMSKKVVADALVTHRAKKEQQALTGTLEQTDSNGAPLRLNNERYLNVLFGTKMSARAKVRGASLTARQLQERVKTDEGFHRMMILEYNDTSNAAYGQNAHGVGCGYKDASNFQAIPVEMWEKSVEKLKELSKEYESTTNRWRQSGFHEDFVDIVPPPEKECTNPSMIYMHHHIRAQPDLLETCLGLLPDNVFRQSSSNPPRGGTRGGNTKTVRRGGGGGRGSGAGRAKSAAAEHCLDSIKSKNNAQQQNILMDTNTKIREELEKEKKKKKGYMEKLVNEHFDDKDTAKRSIKRFKKNNGSGSTNNQNAEDEDFSDNDDAFTESQESTLGNYVDAEDTIAFLKGQLDGNKKALKKFV